MILLAPAPELPFRRVPRTTAFAVVLPECDNDVSGLEGLGYVDRIGVGRRTRRGAFVYLRRANHNFFNSSLIDESGHRRPGCVPRSRRLRKAAQTAWLARYAPAFFHTMLAGAPGPAGAGLDAAAPAPRRIFGRRVLTSLSVPHTHRLVLQYPVGPGSLRRTTAGGGVRATAGVTVGFCQRGRPCRPGLWQPTYPKQLLVAWNRSGGMLENGLGRPRDVRSFQAVRLRVAVDPTSPNNPRGRAQAFSLVLRDAAGRTAAAAIRRTEPALRFPQGRFGRGTRQLSYVISSDVRVRLDRFGGVNLRRVVSVALQFDRTATGSLLLANFELVRR